MNKVLLQTFNEVEQFHWWWEGRRELLKKFLTGQRKNLKILDVGCGTGETLSFLKKTLPNVKLWGIDSSLTAVEFSRRRGHKKVSQNDALNIPFKNNTFDFVLLLDVLEHIKNHRKALNEAKRVLKRNGKIILTAPALKLIWSNHDTMQGHKRRYSKKIINDLAKSLNLKIDTLSFFNFFLFPPIASIRILSRLRPLSWLASYDNSINFEVARKNTINRFLRNLFIREIRLMRYINYPFGVSLLAVLMKE